MDTVDRRTRSRIMARIRSKDTAPELALRRALWRRGIRYRLHRRDLPGTPDVAFHGARVAVFVDSAFWHGRAGIPKTRTAWWRAKLRGNRLRDRRVDRRLLAAGWTVLRVSDRTALADPDGAAAFVGAVVIASTSRPGSPARRFALWKLGTAMHRLSTLPTGPAQ